MPTQVETGNIKPRIQFTADGEQKEFQFFFTLANLCTPVKRIYTQQIKVGIISLTTHPPYDKTANATGAYCARTA